MKNLILKCFLGTLTVFFTFIACFFAWGAYVSLPTQNNGDLINATIWNNTINTINGLGNSVDSLSGSMIGNGQTWQDVTASRVIGTTYTNNTGKPIAVSVTVIGSAGAGGTGIGIRLSVNGVPISSNSTYAPNNSNLYYVTASGIVPPGATYVASNVTTGGILTTWSELR